MVLGGPSLVAVQRRVDDAVRAGRVGLRDLKQQLRERFTVVDDRLDRAETALLILKDRVDRLDPPP